jgi:hypothetical protein
MVFVLPIVETSVTAGANRCGFLDIVAIMPLQKK